MYRQCIDIVRTFIYAEYMTTTIQVRTKPATKKNVKKVLEKLGLDLSTAINIYLVQIIEKQGIPFPILTENGMTPEMEQLILHERDEALKHVKHAKQYRSAKEMHDDIVGE